MKLVRPPIAARAGSEADNTLTSKVDPSLGADQIWISDENGNDKGLDRFRRDNRTRSAGRLRRAIIVVGVLVSRFLFRQQLIWRAIARVVFLILLALLLLNNGIVPLSAARR